MSASEFINFVDYNRHKMNVKGGSCSNDYVEIIITSVIPLEEIYYGVSGEPREQWMRRIKEIALEERPIFQMGNPSTREGEVSVFSIEKIFLFLVVVVSHTIEKIKGRSWSRRSCRMRKTNTIWKHHKIIRIFLNGS